MALIEVVEVERSDVFYSWQPLIMQPLIMQLGPKVSGGAGREWTKE